MSLTAAALVGVAGLGIVPVLALRESRRRRRARAALLDAGRQLLEVSQIAWSEDGFPRLEGRYRARRVIAALVPDTLTMRRLPQLWLSLTVALPLPIDAACAVLVRPNGSEFYALLPALPDRLRPPPDWPDELLLHGRGEGAGRLVAILAPAIARLLQDPRVKEVGVTPRGLRLVWQAAEGALGPHLLLRQAEFPARPIAPAQLARLLDGLLELADRLLPQQPADSAAA
jgi:hypothetical protein